MKKLLAVILAITLVLSLSACGGNGSSANEGKYVIGICQLIKHDALDAATQGFMDAVKEGLGEENVVFDFQDAAGDSNTCSTLVNTFVSNGVDLIMANATPALQAAATATSDIPILGTSVTEYGVALGIEDFSGTVGGNISGTSDLAPLDKQAEMVHTWFPDAKKVGLLFCSAEANSRYQVDTVEKILEEEYGYECTQYSFADTNDMAAIAKDAADNSDVIYIPTDNAVANAAGIVDNVCRPLGVPIIAGESGICSGCGVATLSIEYYDLGVTTGAMAVKILKGEANISEMPIEYAAASTPKYNEEICNELNLTPPSDYVKLG